MKGTIVAALAVVFAVQARAAEEKRFELVEATIEDVHSAIRSGATAAAA